MPKLLIVTDTWTPQINGVVTAYRQIIPKIKARGIDVVVVHPEMFRTIPAPFYPEVRLSIVLPGALRELIEHERPDFIHSAVEGPLGNAARIACRQLALSFTSAYHTHLPQYAERYLGSANGLVADLVWRNLRRFHGSAAATMVATAGLRDLLVAHGFANLLLWPLGTDIELFRPRGKIAGEAAKIPRPRFGYVGRVAKEKSVEEFLNLDLPGAKVVVGDGPMRPQLQAQYPEAHFVGYKHGEDLAAWLSALDVMVFPSRAETFGLVVIEALACGVPVAAHDVMGPRDVLTPGIDGHLSHDLKDAALKCLSLSRAQCRRKALSYSWDASAAAFVDNLVPARDRASIL
ncbi:MAG: glycosyltransferase family 1 protein [Bauldia sp.]